MCALGLRYSPHVVCRGMGTLMSTLVARDVDVDMPPTQGSTWGRELSSQPRFVTWW
jgi:hypothetical protein